MSGTRAASAYALVSAILAVGLTIGILAGPYRAIERSDYMTYHMAAQIVLDGNGDCLYDAECQAEAQQELIGEEPSFEAGALPYNSPPWFAAVVTPLGTLPLAAGFVVFTAIGLAVLAWAARRLTPEAGVPRLLGPVLVLTAWPTVMGAIRGQSTLVVAGLLGLSVALARYGSGAALGLSALKPTLGPLWALWQLIGGHPRAVVTALAVTIGLVGVGMIVVGPTALAAYPAYLIDVAGSGAVGVHPEEMINWRGVTARLGAGDWLTWLGTALTLAVVAFVWLRTRSRALSAAAAFLATPLVLPHANQHEFVLGALGILLVIQAATLAGGAAAATGLVAAAVATHAILWLGPVLPGEVSGMLLFVALAGWLAVVAWRARPAGGVASPNG